jgi:hypothetical protein
MKQSEIGLTKGGFMVRLQWLQQASFSLLLTMVLTSCSTSALKPTSLSAKSQESDLHSKGINFQLDVAYWESSQPTVELKVKLKTNQDCKKCSLDGILVQDLSKESQLEYVPTLLALKEIYPDLIHLSNRDPLILPTAVAVASDYQNYSGFVNNQSNQSNLLVKSYYKTTINYTQSNNYYTNQAANLHNLVLILKDNISFDELRSHTELISKRTGDLKIEEFLPGESRKGSVFFKLQKLKTNNKREIKQPLSNRILKTLNLNSNLHF